MFLGAVRQQTFSLCNDDSMINANMLFLYIVSRDRDAVSDLALHFLAKMKIMVVKDIEREDIEFICKVNTLQRAVPSLFYKRIVSQT